MKADLSFPIGKMGDEDLKGLDMGCLVQDFVCGSQGDEEGKNNKGRIGCLVYKLATQY